MQSRRSFVARVGTLLASSALSGCGMLASRDGGGWGQYTDWTYEPDRDVARFFYLQPADLASTGGVPESIRADEIAGIPYDDVDHFLRFQGGMRSFSGSFGADEFRTAYEEERGITLEEDGERAGYRMYSAARYSIRVGIRGGEAVTGDADEMARFLDAGLGEADSLVDVDEDFRKLTSELDVTHRVSGSVKLSGDGGSLAMEEGQVAAGGHAEYTADGVENVGVVLFETADAVDVDSVVSAYEQSDEVRNLSSSVDGRVVRFSYSTAYE